MKVVGWIHYDWLDEFKLRYPDRYNEDEFDDEKFDALRDEVLSRKLKISGNGHQYKEAGVPVFEDGAILFCTQREWGSLMADIWEPENTNSWKYVKYYLGDF